MSEEEKKKSKKSVNINNDGQQDNVIDITGIIEGNKFLDEIQQDSFELPLVDHFGLYHAVVDHEKCAVDTTLYPMKSVAELRFFINLITASNSNDKI